MANDEHLKILKQGVEVWNEWRRVEYGTTPDISCADLKSADLSHFDLHYVNLSGAALSTSDLFDTDLTSANLSGANLSNAFLTSSNFSRANLRDANFTNARLQSVIFANTDLSMADGLEFVIHYGPSEISISTLYKSGGNIPESFLRGCGVPDDFITFIPSLFGIQQAIQFYSCFISYSHKDEEFAKRLHSRMRQERLRVWFAPEDVKGGQKLHEQLERAIQMHDRLLLVLSESSMQSEWVITEIRKARKAETKEKRRKLFPIRLVDFETIKDWECFDADTGKDLAVEAREYFIPDFSNWKDHDSFEVGFRKLLRDLKTKSSVLDT
jgi:hypothetical protein